LKTWCGQLCACAIKPSSSSDGATPLPYESSKTNNILTDSTSTTVNIATTSSSTSENHYDEFMLTVTEHIKTLIQPCSSTTPCCGLEESIKALKDRVFAMRMLENDENCENVLKNALLKVSVDTMAITALPLDCWLKERLKKWVQLSGHEGTIVPATNQTLWKKQPADNVIEAKAYEKIMKDPSLKGMTPKYYKEIEHKNESFIEIQDLLADFPNTSTRAIMDIKIGTRTFLESEVANSSKRKDLYKKMVDIDPNEPTEEEKADEAITKLRYMQFRERESSSASLGFRIEAAQLPGGKLQKSFKKVKTAENVLQTLKEFLGDRVEKASKELEQRLREMRTSIENSDFFKSHEVVGSSILIIYDEEKSGAWMIDFAKSKQVPENIQLNHRREWEVGNHEDGYLHGLDNLIEILSKCHS
jgi:1D-myo-inositol-triphosphate 3-kinase